MLFTFLRFLVHCKMYKPPVCIVSPLAAVSTTQKALFQPDIHIIFLQRKFHNIVQTVLH